MDKTGKGLPRNIPNPVLSVYRRDKKKGLLDLLFSDVPPLVESFPRDVLVFREGHIPQHSSDVKHFPSPPNVKW